MIQQQPAYQTEYVSVPYSKGSNKKNIFIMTDRRDPGHAKVP